MTTPLDILYEDNHCLAVAKPAALLTQGVPPGIPTLEAMVKAYLKERYHKPGNVYLGIPHRLDRPVSGVVVFARNTKAAPAGRAVPEPSGAQGLLGRRRPASCRKRRCSDGARRGTCSRPAGRMPGPVDSEDGLIVFNENNSPPSSRA